MIILHEQKLCRTCPRTLCFEFSLTRCRNLRYGKCSPSNTNIFHLFLICFMCTFQYCCNQFILVFLSSMYELSSRSTSGNSYKKGSPCLLFFHIVLDASLGCPGCFWTLMFSILLCSFGNVQKDLREEKVEKEMCSGSFC